MQRPSDAARAAQDTKEDERLARQLQQELNSDSSAGGLDSGTEADRALARRLQDEALRDSSRRDQQPSSGL